MYGEIVAILPKTESRQGKIRVGGAVRIISLDLLTDPAPGDTVLVCEGVALGKVDDSIPKEIDYVSGHSR